jgi:hypothetical protein
MSGLNETSWSKDQERHRFEFRIGDAFDPSDTMARYVVRLSQALGDLRIAGSYAVREDQPIYERVYFIRLTASHLHELAILFNPPDSAIPGIEEFIQAVVDPDDTGGAETLRKSHQRVRRELQLTVDVPDQPRLASELRRIRNQFLHYANRVDYEPPLREAIERSAEIESVYVIRERTMRAEYADEINNKLLHPWRLSDEDWIAAVSALHEPVTKLIEPVTDFLHRAEAAYLASRPDGVVRRIDL